ncbi:MAG TPA: TIGR02757 family protein [Bacteroidales bacterium]|nr:TIGR02757 family protein [Bacteroidales bacterium]
MTSLPIEMLRHQLDMQAALYNQPAFIEGDPISIPHRYTSIPDREIAGFFAATLAWGRRDLTIRHTTLLMERMGHEPHRFIMEASEKEIFITSRFIHRTFQPDDCLYFLTALKNIYATYGSLEAAFLIQDNPASMAMRIHTFRERFLTWPHLTRTAKHLADPFQGSAAKRINMLLRWMVRKDNRGVDLGIWKQISPSELHCPLDVHSGRTARRLGLLHRRQNDWKAVEELTARLRQLDPQDPVKYDFALFGAGIQAMEGYS